MTVETDTMKNTRESPSKGKRKRASRSSSSGSSSSGTTSSSSASSRSSSSSSSNSSSSSSRSSSAASSPEKKNDRSSNKATNKLPAKKPVEQGSIDDKQKVAPANQTSRNASPRRQEKEKEATKIYIGKLSLNVNKDHLLEIFGTFGEIKEIDLPASRIHPNLHRGFAHIEYTSPTGAEQACKYMEGGQVDGQEIVCALVHGQPSYSSTDRNRREASPYNRRRRRSPLPPSRHYPPPRRMGDRDRDRERDRGRYNDRRGGYSPPSRNYRRGPSPPTSSRRPGTSGNAAESPKRKERRYSRSSSSESK